MNAQEAFELTRAKSADHEPTEIVERIARAAIEGATSIRWNSYQDVELSEKQIGWLRTNGYKVTEQETVVHGNGGMMYNRTIYTVDWCS